MFILTKICERFVKEVFTCEKKVEKKIEKKILLDNIKIRSIIDN